MGAGYRNTGIIFNNVSVTDGVAPTGIRSMLVPGDEIGVLGTVDRLWAMDVPGDGIRLIMKDGSMYSGSSKDLIVLRSGRRNLLGASSYSVVSLKNPIENGKINITQQTEVLNTTAGTFSDEWSSAAQYIACSNPTGRGVSKHVINKAIENRNINFKPINISELSKKRSEERRVGKECRKKRKKYE